MEELQPEGNVQPIIEFKEKYVCLRDAKITKFVVSSFGRDQTCAMLLGLASGNTFLRGGARLMTNPASGHKRFRQSQPIFSS
jgi:nuclear pore complex protein Nup155